MKTQSTLFLFAVLFITSTSIFGQSVINKPKNPNEKTTPLNEIVIGCNSGDCENGFGRYQYDNGYFFGFFKNGKKHEYGVYVWDNVGKYIGNWENDQMSGYGEYLAENNDNIIGMYKNGQLNGIGYSVLGDVWEQGVYTNGNLTNPYDFQSNNLTIGCTYGNCNTGYGNQVWANGDNFTGFFENGKLKMGVYTFSTGDKYFGQFNPNGEFEGFGRYFYSDGNTYSGGWKKGTFDGKGYYIGQTETEDQLGEWKDGKIIKDMKNY